MPCPMGFVVKNGSNALAVTSCGMPEPVSLTDIATYSLRQPRGAIPVRNSYIPRGNGQPAAIRHRIPAVDREVQDDELQLSRIDHHRPNILLQDRFDPDRGTDCLQQQVTHARNELVQTDDPWCEVLLAGKREQLASEFRASLGCMPGALQDAENVLVVGAEGRQLDVAQDRGQQIIEIMRDAARQLANHFQLLGLAKALLYLAAFRHVPQCAGQPERTAALVPI